MYAGNEKMMEEKGISLSTEQKNQIQALAKQGRTPLLFADEKQFLGIVAVADVVKPTSKEAVQKFRDYGNTDNICHDRFSLCDGSCLI